MIVLTICCSQGRDPGRLGLGAVRPEHGRLPQPHDQAQDPEGGHCHAQRLPGESPGAWGHVSHCTRDTWQGYYNALERTFFMDHVDDASLKYWEVNCAVHRRGLELIR